MRRSLPRSRLSLPRTSSAATAESLLNLSISRSKRFPPLSPRSFFSLPRKLFLSPLSLRTGLSPCGRSPLTGLSPCGRSLLAGLSPCGRSLLTGLSPCGRSLLTGLSPCGRSLLTGFSFCACSTTVSTGAALVITKSSFCFVRSLIGRIARSPTGRGRMIVCGSCFALTSRFGARGSRFAVRSPSGLVPGLLC